ncbi:glycerophosphoryl diester phosphodiesterase membrane domain-containing protein [Kitasatospora sp. NPDC001175]|uniref:glycerophosphoryl diester phosphodiesterase membrane domain-containing protein n=1 Tax=Kitasatospora sp. NPDC001175 TaxID=3157103 RepID=UPI003CFDBC39
MTDNPGWAPPGSPEPPREAAGPSATPSTPAPEGAAPREAAGPPAPAPGPDTPRSGPQDAPPQGWSAPGPHHGYGTAPGPQPGWNGHPGWGGQPGWNGQPGPGGFHPGWGAPPSPKPGVIPLRPLAFGEILDGAVTTVRRHWRTALGLSFGVAAVEQTLSALARWWAYESPHTAGPVVALFATYPVNFVLGIIAAGLLTMVVSKAVLGRPTTLGEVWRDARPQLLKLAGVTFLTSLIIGGVFLVACAPLIAVLIAGDPGPELVALTFLPILAAVPVALWLGIQLNFSAPALMLEKQGVRTALARSRRLVKGSWWRVFGITLLSQIVVGILSSVIAMPFIVIGMVLSPDDPTSAGSPFGQLAGGPPAMLASVAVGGTLVATITIPVLAAVNVLLYIDQRIRREALDIGLARAAGVPEFGGTAPTGPQGSTAPGGPQRI